MTSMLNQMHDQQLKLEASIIRFQELNNSNQNDQTSKK